MALTLGLMAAVVIPCYAVLRPDYKCGEFVYSGCATSYPCADANADCPNGAGHAVKKKGTAQTFRVCISATGFTCNQVPKVCFQEDYYVDFGCTTGCGHIDTMTDGCP